MGLRGGMLIMLVAGGFCGALAKAAQCQGDCLKPEDEVSFFQTHQALQKHLAADNDETRVDPLITQCQVEAAQVAHNDHNDWAAPKTCCDWLRKIYVHQQKQATTLEKTPSMAGKTIEEEDRIGVLCRSWLIYQHSPDQMAAETVPADVTKRITKEMSMWDNSRVRGLPESMSCSEKLYDVDLGNAKKMNSCWEQLGDKEFLEGQNGQLHILSYGSLMNGPAAGFVEGSAIPVVVYGNLVRSSVLLHPKPEVSPYMFSDKQHKDVEACRYSVDFLHHDDMFDFKGIPHLMNGVVQTYDLKGEGLNAFRLREQGYDLARVPVIRISELQEPGVDGPLEPFWVWTLKQDIGVWKALDRYASPEQAPNLLYAFDSLQNDEGKFGAGFNRLMADSTYLQNRQDESTGEMPSLADYVKEELEKLGLVE